MVVEIDKSEFVIQKCGCRSNDNMETRKHNRLKGYDYSQNGYYFITICTVEKSKILCDISVGANCVRPELCRPKTTFSKIGKIVDENINILNNIF